MEMNHEELRRKLWIDIAASAAIAQAQLLGAGESPERCADRMLAEFDVRFPVPQRVKFVDVLMGQCHFITVP